MITLSATRLITSNVTCRSWEKLYGVLLDQQRALVFYKDQKHARAVSRCRLCLQIFLSVPFHLPIFNFCLFHFNCQFSQVMCKFYGQVLWVLYLFYNKVHVLSRQGAQFRSCISVDYVHLIKSVFEAHLQYKCHTLSSNLWLRSYPVYIVIIICYVIQICRLYTPTCYMRFYFLRNDIYVNVLFS